MCRRIYDWNIVKYDVKQPYSLTHLGTDDSRKPQFLSEEARPYEKGIRATEKCMQGNKSWRWRKISLKQQNHFLSSNIPSSPAYGGFTHNSSDTPGPLMNVLFWGRCDFPISFSGRDMLKNVWDRLLGSSMVGTGIWGPPLSNVTWHSGWWHLQWPLYWSGITLIFDPITDLDIITELPNCERFP